MKKEIGIGTLLVGLVVVIIPSVAFAIPQIDISIGSTDEPKQIVTGLKLLGLLSVLAIAPAILVTMTCFTRILIVFSFLRQAIGTQQIPPNQVMISLALFLTIFVMAPVGERIYDDAITPYQAGQIEESEAFERAKEPIRNFMLNYTREKDLMLFYEISDTPLPQTAEEVELKVLVPAFIISELKTAFEMGFMLFIPFIILDIAIASMLMSMGMIMLPPALISLPLKLMLFVVVDGWNLVVTSVIRSLSRSV